MHPAAGPFPHRERSVSFPKSFEALGELDFGEDQAFAGKVFDLEF